MMNTNNTLKGKEILKAMLARFKQDNLKSDQPGIFEVSADIMADLDGVKVFDGVPVLLNSKLQPDTAHLYEKRWYNRWVKQQIEFQKNLRAEIVEENKLKVLN